MDKIITDNSKVNLNLVKENETLKNLLEIERQQVKRLAEQLNLSGVSNRRELLIATLHGWQDYKDQGMSIEDYVDEIESNL